MTDCVFCKIAKKEIPATIVYEDDATIAFMDAFPVSPGHVLIAPKRHVKDIYALDDMLAGVVFQAAARVARATKIALNPDGMSLLQANESAGWQTVFHFHIHVIPRRRNDGIGLTWPAKGTPREALEDIAEAIRKRMKD